MSDFKTCYSCKEEQPTCNFSKHTVRPDGLSTWCKSCTAKKYKAYTDSIDTSLSHSDYIRIASEKFDYDSIKGELRYKGTGRIAGTVKSTGYVRVRINRVEIEAHRVAWMIHYREYPNWIIDHINGDKSDNRISNLRKVTHKENMQNQRSAQVDNKSGFLGVSKRGNKFSAQIRTDDKFVYLGLFATAELAHAEYVAAKRKFHKGCTL